jgi:hypothetical protein
VGAWSPLLLAPPILAAPPFWLPPIVAPPSPCSSNASSRGRTWGCETPRAPLLPPLPPDGRWHHRAWMGSRRATFSPLLGGRGRRRRGDPDAASPTPYLPLRSTPHSTEKAKVPSDREKVGHHMGAVVTGPRRALLGRSGRVVALERDPS